MKELLEQANSRLKSLTSTTSAALSTGTAAESREDVMGRLQQQLDQLKMKVFKINSFNVGSQQGLIDSGATHPLRPLRMGEAGEDYNDYKKVAVTMANGESTSLQVTLGGVKVTEKMDVEPILPMGQLVRDLQCEVSWKEGELQVTHPLRGPLPVRNQEGSPQIPRALALELIEELEVLGLQSKMKSLNFEKEHQWMKSLVQTHPVLRRLPQKIKDSLAVKPGDWKDLPVNRRVRKILQRDGFIAHIYAGEPHGFTLSRAWQQQGGSQNQLLEIDLKHGSGHDMLLDVGVYSDLMCAVMHDKIEAVVGGPNCRTRSVLRHRPKANVPRPVRAWGGEEFGLKDLTKEEEQVTQDDILMWRFVFLWMVATYMRAAKQVQRQVGLLLEQPASPKRYQPQCVSFWDTSEWKQLREEFNLDETTFCQGHQGGFAVKPTTMAGNLELNVEGHKMRCNLKEPKDVGSSAELSRWAPGTMRMVTEALLTQVIHRKPKMAPLSWQEHIQHGHIPFRRDCLICQQSLQQQPPHRRVKHLLGGVLSVDTAGPFIRAHDVGGYKAAYILVGALTWTVPADLKLKEDEVEELEEIAPNFDAHPDQEPPAIEDQPPDPQPEIGGVFNDTEEEGEEGAVEVQRAPRKRRRS